MEFDDYFQTLTSINASEEKNDYNCCENIKNHLYDEGIITCKECNNTITNIIENPEWRYYGANDSKNNDPTRCGMPTNLLLPKSSLGTTVSYGNNSETMNKVAMYQRWNSMPYKERSLYKVFSDIQAKCKENNLPDIISETAKSLYTIISKTKISRGSNRQGIIGACVYHACKECCVPRSINELSSMFNITPKIMTKGCKNYTEIMRMSNTDMSRIQNIQKVNLYDFIGRFCDPLKLSDNDKKKVIRIAQICEDFNLINDNTPPSMAAGCIYLYIKMNDLQISKKDISDICKISEVTINKCYKKLANDQKITGKLKELGFNNIINTSD